MKYDNCKDCTSGCEHAGKDREFICPKEVSCKVTKDKGCDFCKGRAYTKKPVEIRTVYGKRFKMVFEYCPNCGRKLRTENV